MLRRYEHRSAGLVTSCDCDDTRRAKTTRMRREQKTEPNTKAVVCRETISYSFMSYIHGYLYKTKPLERDKRKHERR